VHVTKQTGLTHKLTEVHWKPTRADTYEEESCLMNLMYVTSDYTVRYRDLMTMCGELLLQ